MFFEAILRCVDVVQYGIFHVLYVPAFTYPDILKSPKYRNILIRAAQVLTLNILITFFNLQL